MPGKESGGGTSIGERYRVLLDVGRTLAATLSSQDVYAAIHRESTRVLEATGFYVSLYDPSRDLARIVFCADRQGVRTVEVSYRGSDSAVLSSREALVITDLADDPSVLPPGPDEGDDTRSAISAPMIHKGRLVGALAAHTDRPNAYGEEDLALLQGIADIAAVAIDNAHTVEELDRRRAEAEQIEEIGRALAGSLDTKEVLDLVISAVLDVVEVDGAGVWLCDDPSGLVARVAASGGEIALPVGLEWDLDGVLAGQLIEARKPVLVDDLAASPLIPPHLREYLEAGSGAGVPLVVGGSTAGILTAGSRSLRGFSPDDTAVLQRLAAQASVALENARLHSHLQALSLTDPLTGLPNRRRLQMHLDKEVAAARRGRPVVVVVFDIDDFKHYNDTLGHITGDDILRAFAQILDETNRAMNLVVRYGGDEFISILSDSDRKSAQLYVDRLRERVAVDPILSPLGISVSTGMSEFDSATMRTMEDLIRAADTEMYRAKAERRTHKRSTPS